jgi:hypothetical protein
MGKPEGSREKRGGGWFDDVNLLEIVDLGLNAVHLSG